MVELLLLELCCLECQNGLNRSGKRVRMLGRGCVFKAKGLQSHALGMERMHIHLCVLPMIHRALSPGHRSWKKQTENLFFFSTKGTTGIHQTGCRVFPCRTSKSSPITRLLMSTPPSTRQIPMPLILTITLEAMTLKVTFHPHQRTSRRRMNCHHCLQNSATSLSPYTRPETCLLQGAWDRPPEVGRGST